MYLMIKRLLELKNTVIDMALPDITMTDFQWFEIERLEAILRHPFLMTKRLQTAELTPSFFHKEWQKLLLTFSQIGEQLQMQLKSQWKKERKFLIMEYYLLQSILTLCAG
ncbi:hypothetical protein DMUE_6397 [Dictyocoela muelleri]|nr:hypothetical protein DMUE_6397 [Dictyocoela muelleri]